MGFSFKSLTCLEFFESNLHQISCLKIHRVYAFIRALLAQPLES